MLVSQVFFNLYSNISPFREGEIYVIPSQLQLLGTVQCPPICVTDKPNVNLSQL